MKVNLFKKQKIDMTVIDVASMLIGKTVVWAMITIFVFYFMLFVGKILWRIISVCYPVVIAHLGFFLSLFILASVLFYVIHYFRHDFVILHFDGAKYVVRRRILRFIRKPRVFNNYDLKG